MPRCLADHEQVIVEARAQSVAVGVQMMECEIEPRAGLSVARVERDHDGHEAAQRYLAGRLECRRQREPLYELPRGHRRRARRMARGLRNGDVGLAVARHVFVHIADLLRREAQARAEHEIAARAVVSVVADALHERRIGHPPLLGNICTRPTRPGCGCSPAARGVRWNAALSLRLAVRSTRPCWSTSY